MNGVGQAHPDREQLSAFGLGRLDDAAAATVHDHLEQCPLCRQVLEDLPPDSFVARLKASFDADTLAAHEAPTLTRNDVAAKRDASGEVDVPAELAQHPRYRILGLLGSGGMGVVYKAEHLLMGRIVALKVLNRLFTRDPDAVERFRREVRSVAQLQHPHIVTAYDAEQAGDVHFLVMEYVEGDSLDRLVKREGPLPSALAVDYVRQAALGLQHAHRHGMVHRDIKPGNLMRTPDGTIKILDFGLARFAREHSAQADANNALGHEGSITLIGAVMGTPDYMAPEQAADPQTADIRADIYSLGCTLYYLLAGQAPFPRGEVIDKLIGHAELAPQPVTQLRPDVPIALARVIERMMAKKPDRRYQTPSDIVQALDALGNPADEQSLPMTAADGPRRRRRWIAVASAACGGVILALVLMVLMLRGREETLNEQLTTLYSVCAVLGGTLLVCQFLLGLFGLGHHLGDGGGFEGHDIGGHFGHAENGNDTAHDSHATGFMKLLTFRTLVAAVAFFGLGGRAAGAAGFDPAKTLFVAVAAGAGALFLVAWLMRTLVSLQSDGSVRIGRAVGHAGTVYLPIPGRKAGVGKVLLNIQNRTMEYQAVTAEDTLESGSKVVVVAVLGSDTLEVIPAPKVENVNHV